MDKLCNVISPRPNASDLLLDLLVAKGSAMPVQVLCQAGALLGVRETTVRVCLSRLLSEGKIARTTRGHYVFCPQGPAVSRTVYAWRMREAEQQPWHGQWLAVQDSGVLRSDKTSWRRHQLAMGLRGFASLQTGLRLRPDNLAGGVSQQRQQLLELGMAGQALVFGLGELDALNDSKARRLWNVKALAAAHRHWLQLLQQSQQGLSRLPLESALRESLLLGRQVIAHLLRDPLLPSELMPPQPRLALHETMADYQKQALRLWLRWLQQTASPMH